MRKESFVEANKRTKDNIPSSLPLRQLSLKLLETGIQVECKQRQIKFILLVYENPGFRFENDYQTLLFYCA